MVACSDRNASLAIIRGCRTTLYDVGTQILGKVRRSRSLLGTRVPLAGHLSLLLRTRSSCSSAKISICGHVHKACREALQSRAFLAFLRQLQDTLT